MNDPRRVAAGQRSTSATGLAGFGPGAAATSPVRHVLPGFGALPADPRRDPISGIVGTALGLAYGQAASGREVEVWGLSREPARGAYRHRGVLVDPVRAWRHWRVSGYDFRYLLPLTTRSMRTRPAGLLHIHSNPFLLYLPAGRARILHLHGEGDFSRTAARAILRRADAVVTVSQDRRARFLARVEYPADRCHVVHPGVDPSQFGVAPARARLWSDEPGMKLLFAGAISPEKGLHELLAAFRQLQHGSSPSRLVVAGSSTLWWTPDSHPGPGLTRYEREARELAAGLPVTFLGPVAHAEMPPLLAACDVVVVPSIVAEGFGLIALEAQAAGKPVVGFRVGGLPEVVVAGESGLLVPARDVRRLADALRALSGNPELRRAMGERARRQAAQFSWEAAVRRLDRISCDVAASIRGPGR